MLDFTKFRECTVENNYASEFYEYNGKIYYCRKSMTYYELIICSIAKYLGVESVDYLLAKKGNDLYLVSESFMRDGERFVDGFELLEEYKARHNIEDYSHLPGEKLNNLTDIAIILEESIPFDSLQLMQGLTDIFSLDVILGNCDRQSPNWGTLQASEYVRLAPMYDGKWSFSTLPPLLLVSEEDRGKSVEAIIEHFLNTASLSSIKKFIDYYKHFNVKDLRSLVSSIASTNDIGFNVDKICMNFTSRREIITKVLNK